MATIKLEDLKIGFNDQFFFDTNVWLLLFGTVADFQKKEQQSYSKLLENLLTRDGNIYITSMIISEFSNVLLRRDFYQWKDINNFHDKDFKKDFVGTVQYKNSVQTISIAIKKILGLPVVEIVGDNFNAISIDKILENFKTIDFNDSYIIELAILNKYRIVTNDGDFKKLNINVDIITALM